MKNFKTLFASLLFLVTINSCEKQDSFESQDLSESIDFDMLEFDDDQLNIDFATSNEIFNALDSHFEGLLTRRFIEYSDNAKSASNKSTPIYVLLESQNGFTEVSLINDISEFINEKSIQAKSDPVGVFDEADLNCTKCRGEDCVKSAVSNAIGYATSESLIQITPNFTLSVRTSVTVCSGSTQGFLDSL